MSSTAETGLRISVRSLGASLPVESMKHIGDRVKRRQLTVADGLSLLSVAFLCFCVCRTGHETGYVPVLYAGYAVIALNIFRIKDFQLSKLKPALPFFAVALISPLVQALFVAGPYYSISNAFNAAILFAVFCLCAGLLIVSDDLSGHVWKIINFVSLSASILILIEYLTFLAGIRLYSIPVQGDWVFNAWEFEGSGAYRPCAYFSEASHFAELALLSAFYFLYVANSRLKFVLVFSACVASTSSLGIIGCAGLALVYVFFFSYSKRRLIESGKGKGMLAMRIFLIALSCIALIAAIVYLQSSDSWFATRIMDGGTSSMRMSRSFELFSIMAPLEQLFGFGLQNQAIYLNANGIVLPSDYNETLVNREFAATIGYVLCTNGVCGLLAFLYMFLPGFKSRDGKIKVLTGLLLYISFTCCIMSRGIFIVMLLVLFAYGNGYWTTDRGLNG